MKNLLIFVLVAAVIGVFTNPGPKEHQEAVIEQVKSLEEINGDIDGNDLKQLGALLGDAIGLNTLERYAKNNVEVKDLKVCSLTQLKINGELKTIGIGAFGNVWMLDDLKDRVVEVMEK